MHYFNVASLHRSLTRLMFCRFTFLFVTFLFVFVLYDGKAHASSGADEAPGGGITETTTLLAEIPEKAAPVGESIRALPDKGKIAYVVESENGFTVCMNTNCGPYVDRVARDMPVVSPNGNHVAAVVQTDDDVRVMLGEHMGKAYDMIFGLRFSPDSMTLAYIAQKEDAFFVYVNQERHQAFAMIDPSQGLIFSEDSSRLAYVASTDGQSWRLVHNGEAGEAFQEIKHVTFSPDSEQLVYAAKTGGQWHLVEDGDKRPGRTDIMRVRFSPDSNRLVYVARDDDGAFVVLDGEKLGVFDYVPGEPVFSNDGKRLAYAVAEEHRRRGIRMRMVVDGEVGPAFEQIGAYRFSRDGEQFAYMAVVDKDKEKARIVHNGEAQEVYQSIGTPVFSPNGNHLAYYVFIDELWHVVKDGEVGPGFYELQDPVFSPDGARMAYLARIGSRWMVVEDGDLLSDYAWASMITFSPDSQHLAYAAAEGGESFLVVDGQEGEEPFLSFVRGSPLVFTDDNTVQGIAVRALAEGSQEFWLIRAEIEK